LTLLRWILVWAFLGAGLALVACGDDGDVASPDGVGTTTVTRSSDTDSDATASGSAATRPPNTDTSTPPDSGNATQTGGTTTQTYAEKPAVTIDTGKRYFATIRMDIGDIKIELFPDDAPETVNSFIFLAREGFYDGITFHRVIPGFVAQAGDPTGTGRGGPGYNIPDEVNERQFLDGTVGMAKTAAPNSAGSQFFICYSPQPNLDGFYTVFGQVVEGRDVLDSITPRDPAEGGPAGTVINTIVIEES
jgi:cyclophilin family peptidyl-prolyl cis-trans isomerase